MRDVVIAGVGMTAFGKMPDRSFKSLVAEAITEALADAGVTPDTAATEVGTAYLGNVFGGRLQGQDSIRGQVWMSESALAGVPTINVENACASGSTSLHGAWLAVASGQTEVAAAVGVEKLHVDDKAKAFAAMASAIDQDRVDDIRAQLGVGDAGGRSVFMDVYADFARRYAERTGATVEDFARVAAKNHGNGALNPKAQYRQTFTVQEVLDGRPISGPLTLPMCAPMGDGAAAVVVTTAERAARWDAETVRLLAVAIGGGRVGTYGQLVPATAARAYETAGIGPGDIDVIECHDATAPAELIVMEELGVCAPGEAPQLVREGATALGGRLPINPSGGLESKGHPLGATGLAQVVELADQLRKRCGPRQVDGARLALAENAGGYLGPDTAVATVTILGSVQR